MLCCVQLNCLPLKKSSWPSSSLPILLPSMPGWRELYAGMVHGAVVIVWDNLAQVVSLYFQPVQGFKILTVWRCILPTCPRLLTLDLQGSLKFRIGQGYLRLVIPNIISHRPPECRIAVAPFFCLPQFSGSNSLAIWPQVTGLYAAERSSLVVIPVYKSISEKGNKQNK